MANPNATSSVFLYLEGLWEEAGGSALMAPVMAAVAMAESSGIASADVSDPTVSDRSARSVGLWQINSGDWPGLVRAGILHSLDTAEQELKDPYTNAWAANYIANNSLTSVYNNWSTYHDYVDYTQGGPLTRGASVISQWLGNSFAFQIPDIHLPAGPSAAGARDWNMQTKNIIVWTILVLFGILAIAELRGDRFK